MAYAGIPRNLSNCQHSIECSHVLCFLFYIECVSHNGGLAVNPIFNRFIMSVTKRYYMLDIYHVQNVLLQNMFNMSVTCNHHF